MNRRPTTQDISWFLDLENNKQLNLDPPYQRRSVWTRKDKQFFLDTIFRDFPSPAIFLHKTMDEKGRQIYNVVDGKQRISTILEYVRDKLTVSKEFGDVALDGKKWSQLKKLPEWQKMFWDYVLTVEMLDIVEGTVVNNVFDRLNRNSRKLDRQELRHAKFDGWLIKFAEAEGNKEYWRDLEIVTVARARRMHDAQFLSELLLVILDKKIIGFDQDYLDEKYSEYDAPLETIDNFSVEDVSSEWDRCTKFIQVMQDLNACITKFAKGVGNFYTLWSVVALGKNKIGPAKATAVKYSKFMAVVTEFSNVEDPDALLAKKRGASRPIFAAAHKYFMATKGASTDLGPREARFSALLAALKKT